MATFAFLLLGIVASLRIPTSLMPDITIPEITVQLSYPNTTARELETNVVRPLRNQLLQVANLKDIETEIREGFANLKLLPKRSRPPQSNKSLSDRHTSFKPNSCVKKRLQR